MRLTALVLATGLLWPASTFAQDEGTSHPGFLKGNKLYEECSSQDYSLCLGYVMGVSDALNATKPNFFCAPLSVQTAGLTRGPFSAALQDRHRLGRQRDAGRDRSGGHRAGHDPGVSKVLVAGAVLPRPQRPGERRLERHRRRGGRACVDERDRVLAAGQDRLEG